MKNKSILDFKETKILLIIISLVCPIFGIAAGVIILLGKEKQYENIGETMVELSIIEALIIIIPWVSNNSAAKLILKILPILAALFFIFVVVLFYRMVTFEKYNEQLEKYYERENLPEEASKFKFYGILPEIHNRNTDFYIWKWKNNIILLDYDENGFGKIKIPTESFNEISMLLRQGKEYAIVNINCEDGAKELVFEKQIYSKIIEMI